MFPMNQYLQNSRSSSFLIRDILRSDGTYNPGDKYSSVEQTFGGSSASMYAGQGASSCQNIGYYPNTTVCYPDFRKGIFEFMIQSFRSYPDSLNNPLPNKPRFLLVCSTSLLKTLWGKKKLLVKSNFSFFRSVFFYLFGELSKLCRLGEVYYIRAWTEIE